MASLPARLSCELVSYKYLFLVFWCIVVFVPVFVVARPTSNVQLEDGRNVLNNWDTEISLPSWLGIVVSLSFLVILVSLLALCGAGGCCGKIQWFGRRRQEAPLSFSNPMTEPAGSTMMIPISQIDVRALEVDPIVFEPLPTVHDLTPLSNKLQNDRGHSIPPHASLHIVPFSADDSNIYAHDWFEVPHTHFPRSNIEYDKVIGKGWFGQVIEAEARDIVPFARKIRVVVKVLREDANGVEQMRFLNEARIYRDGNDGNILKLLDYSIEKLPFLLIMEHCPQGDLKSFLVSNVTRAEMLNNQGTIAQMALDVARGLEWLHNSGAVHPDLAARNCQVGSENRVVLGDYGLGTQNFQDDYHWSSNVAIPLRWAAPETLYCTSSVIQVLKVTESSNVWTFGVVAWEICEFGKLPYFELADDEVITRVIIEKNYFLGRPTLACLSVKEELYKIMTSCWQPEIDDRPHISTIVRQLESLCKSFSYSAPTVKDEFDSKWDQLENRKDSMDDDKRRKKNVSFVGLESSDNSSSMESTLRQEETMRNLNSTGNISEFSDLSHDVVFDKSKDAVDLEEEQWTKKIERGDITQKVLEKSQSVQDLMVLTHIEKNDIGDLDSLICVSKSPVSSVLDETELDESVNSSTLRKSISETAIDSFSIANSSHTLTPSSVSDSLSQSSTLVPGEPSVIPATPEGKTNGEIDFNDSVASSSVEINVIQATPSPAVEINVIDATPNRPSFSSPTDRRAEPEESLGGESDVLQRKLHFTFDSSPVQVSRQRLTSTPLRSGSTPSPRISDFGDKDIDFPVFETSENFMEGTFSISPISLHYATNSFSSSKEEKSSISEPSVVFGPSDDHELGSYQGVKSQLNAFSEGRDIHNDADDDEKNVRVMHEVFSTPQPLSQKVSLLNGDTNEAAKKPGSKSEKLSDAESNNGQHSEQNSKSLFEEDSDNDDFWKQQLKSLQVAAGDTRQLFQIGLIDPDDLQGNNRQDDKRFVEDIEAAAEELGSLVMHDLEGSDSDCTKTIIKETREAIEPDVGVSAKLAFEGSSNAEETSAESTQTTLASEFEDNSWSDISTQARTSKSTTLKGEHESDADDTDEAVSKDFVPSKWNQSLVPDRSAIKSPDQQLKSGVKKSVSFEMKRTQLVYEYPPPPVVSDSEEEERSLTSALASASLPITSSSLDWELTQEELDNAEINNDDWEDDISPKQEDPMDVYRISGFGDDNFQIRGSSEPFVFTPPSPSTLGELRHTRDRLRLDLSRGEANFLDEDSNKTNPAKLDSGVGSSTNVSPFNNCDILTKRNKSSD